MRFNGGKKQAETMGSATMLTHIGSSSIIANAPADTRILMPIMR